MLCFGMRNVVVTALFLGFVCKICYAQWTEQSLGANVGWNALVIQVDPSPPEADQLFAGHPIDAVWTPADPMVILPPECTGADDAANCTAIQADRWWVWVPPDSPQAVVRTLRRIQGGRVYLIHATAPTTLTLFGRPVASKTHWRKGYNLAGFHVTDDAAAAPTFSSYLAPSAAFANAKVFSIRSDGAPISIPNLTTAKITAGQGYWVSAASDTTYSGPVDIDAGSLRGIDFAESGLEHTLRLENLASAPRQISVRYVPSAAAPAQPPGSPTVAGDVPLEYLEYRSGDAADLFEWLTLTAANWDFTSRGTDNALRSVRMAVRRAGLSPADVDPAGHGSQYQGLLEITDGAGFRRLVPVAAQVRGGSTVAGAETPHVGLWFGHVTVDAVSWATSSASGDIDNVTPRPVASPFAFPVLIHVASNGTANLLTEITIMWRPGVDGAPGDYAIVTPTCPPEVKAELEAGSRRDGEPFSRRITTAAFSFDGDVLMNGTTTSVLTASVVIPADHRLNPFKHRYHPEHDCNVVGECYEIHRDLTFTFESDRPDDIVRPGWGDQVIGGDYSETVFGLNNQVCLPGDEECEPQREPIHARGRFELSRIVPVGALNGL